ncbi:Alpha/beta hydrolase family protein [Reichenbachiella faecimaris]|uniref:Alpha/beta hydrolase family protein n=1 Tax=Reichenbachiella faecimaris TaxID=692418 RepID=A0A1W2G803_REIFA|nr:alpha/beta hydrolase [Reichenbachiella faecimaris]SMD32634.1 Alpha/beta hydrolase family protein [Reichenbachiella faecimaris]
MLKLIQFYFKIAAAIAPKMAGNQAFELFQRPLNKKIRQKEISFFKVAKSFKIKHYLEDIQCYELGNPSGQLVLLVHGWESNAASMSAIGLKLAEEGHHVILFNLPAHGFSKLRKANIKMCKEVFLEVINHLNPKQPFSVISHSFGSAVTSYALSKTTHQVDQLIFLTTPNSITKIFEDYSHFIGINQAAHEQLCIRAENILHEPLDGIRVDLLGEKIRYNHLLLIHDSEDKILPKSNSIDIYNQWPKSELKLLQRTGHYKMLWDQKVISLVLDQLSKGSNIKKEKSLYAMAF